MKKYTKQAVFDYLLGNDIDGFDIDELENNPEFMAEVVCKDKNAYNLCSDEVKRSYRFVRPVLDYYKSDVDFALELYKGYDSAEAVEEDEFFELNIMMRKITKNEDYMVRLPYVVNTDVPYTWDQFSLNAEKENYPEDFNNYIGLGFVLQKDKYNNNKTILDFIAERYIDQLLFNGINLEEKLHKLYKSYDEYKANGIFTPIVKFLSTYDYELASYVSQNTDVLADLKKELERIGRNWYSYDYHKEVEEREKRGYDEQKYNRIIDRTIEYCEKEDTDFDHYDALSYFGKLFGVKEELEAYLFTDEDIINITENEIFENKISEEDGYRIIDNVLEDIEEDKRLGLSRSLLDNPWNPLNKKSISRFDASNLDAIERIFEEELGYTIEQKQSGIKSPKKVIKFNRKKKNKE